MSANLNNRNIGQGKEKNGKSRKYGFAAALAVFVLLIMIILHRVAAANEQSVYYRTTMDTSVELRFNAPPSSGPDLIAEKTFAEMENLEALLSRSISSSEVRAINRKAGEAPVPVEFETYHLVSQALQYAASSGGAFDPTIGPLIDLWGFLGQEYRLPGDAEIEAVLPLVDHDIVEMNPDKKTVYLPREGMALDLGGIAKGYIIDGVVDFLVDLGVKSAFVNAGGDIKLLGPGPEDRPWRVGIRHPRKENRVIAVLNLESGAIVTSGDYERTFTANGINYHHLLNPDTGYPARGLASVTVVAGTAIAADALSTALFVLGVEEGLKLIEKVPGAEGVFITTDLEIIVTEGLSDIIELEP
ncbi:MAG: FAD:protein FMN transferase [Bacillota bacterium]|nr:FAD:protein FMN transferase [Bacillota bacterium]